ncbi:class I SAM-dependent methyltransferase [Flavobacterium columnare]|nr:class I SAM-dependent methyltransferase [Flavobacterium columnare]AUX17005.1 methyltransferase type 12 [Flavobacterium columnare]MEB3800762.1 class I SAM-dependent methyltransferase [Flavobacterium columnare]QOG56013.1 class I SAM-dependent methyltransferase [Flavobacterium columnare]QOG58734.1 class I SAM-dependent methyltransferase [Flavobacterium columnare]QOG61457.1 class I SAM-dependent methyltransferase [Flavobacterium columnare]
MEDLNYLEINRKTWNEKTAIHINSDFYDTTSFLKGKSTLNDIELKLLGNIQNKSILHLQCHFGQDSMSLQRMGAQVTAIDLSDKAIETAQSFNAQLGLNTRFFCCDVYDSPNHIQEKFDLVFTSYGTIGWLPNLDKWAQVVSHFLKPNGQFIFVEFHPVVWMFDNDFKKISYNYFNIETIIEEEKGTYGDRDSDIKTKTISWNHPTSEVLNALIKNSLQINSFEEYDYSPYNCFNQTEEFEKGKFRIKHLKNKIPMIFSLTASKK